MVVGLNLSWQGTKRERQCTLEGQTRYVNVQSSVHWNGVHRVGEWRPGGAKFFNWLLKLTNQK